MTLSLTDRAEAALLARQALPPALGPGSVRPSYDALGLGNAAARAAALLVPDLPLLDNETPLPPLDPAFLGDADVTAAWQAWLAAGPVRHVIVLLMDALGYDQLRFLMRSGVASCLGEAAAGEGAFFIPITTVFPSATTVALTALATAHAPATHGILGTNLYLREIGATVNLIGYRPHLAPAPDAYTEAQLDPVRLVSVPNLYRRLEAVGIRTEMVNPALYKGTGFNRFISAGSRAEANHFHGYLTPADGFARCRERLLNHEPEVRSYTYLYVPSIDTVAHRYGPLTPSYEAEMATLDFSLHRELIAPLRGRGDTVLLLLADHGQITRDPGRVVWMEDHPELISLLAGPMTGEPRAGYLHTRHGRAAEALAYVEDRLGAGIEAMPKARAVELGLFGPPGAPLGDACDARTGDILLLPRADWTVRHHLTYDERHPGYVGVHGGLSRAEMLVPFLALRL